MKIYNNQYLQQNITYNQSFTAIPGKHLLNYLAKNEFHSDKNKIKKFQTLFSKVFENITDQNTVIDIDKSKNLIFSHLLFPNIKYCYKNSPHKNKPLSQAILNECSKTIGRGEYLLFENIIRTELKNGNSIDNLRLVVNQKFSDPKRFIKELSIAEKIKAENPHSELSTYEFSDMTMKIMKEFLDNHKDFSLSKIISGLQSLV